ncbi:uncharacterized protein NEMAJ01_0866 [Nematocida major]|uniref:uncharacterized protein n=2 Tax=Nematocida major TaxID=1912982 RepID=UPI0020078B54|nr:uncharacterized protein NEMAJ01_0866 [Nematocida major]KAH9385970.1 hypothetical protein NEMAJ01_0866 [Nematocida major]
MPKAYIRLQVGLIWALAAALRHAGCVYFTNKDAMSCVRAVVGCVRGEDVLISPWWAGHPLCIAKLGWLGYVYNMRAYSCGLATSFSLVPRKENGKEVYTYTREPEKDRAHQPEDIASAVVLLRDRGYSVKFHRALVHMFGLQRDGKLAVETGRPCSFTEFLRESCRTKKEAHYVLAALVLLSEGVDVPIETAGNRVIIKKRKGSEEALVDAHINVPAVESGERQLSETWQVVNFFKRHRGTHMLPSTYEEFKMGGFLESPQLLILTYVGEYVKSAEELMSVMECMFNLLEGMGLAESLKDPGSVVGRMFMSASRLSEARAFPSPFFDAQAEAENSECLKTPAELYERLCKASAQYRQQACASGLFLAECIDRMPMKITDQRVDVESIPYVRAAAKEIVDYSPNKPNRLFLKLPTFNIDSRRTLVYCFLLYARERFGVLAPAHPMARLVTNLIGSVQLTDPHLQKTFLCVPIAIGALHALCPTVQLSAAQHVTIFKSRMLAKYAGLFSPRKSNMLTGQLIIDHFRMYAEKTAEPLFECKLLRTYMDLLLRSHFLFIESPLETLQEIVRLVLAEHAGQVPEKALALVRKLTLSWFIYMLTMGQTMGHAAVIQIYHIVEPAHFERH